MVISNVQKMILYMSCAYIGREHDMTILKSEFGHRQGWFRRFHVWIDLGFQGFEKHFKALSVNIPHRKKRSTELTGEQKSRNREVSKERIVVEHSIAGLKRYGLLRERVRNKKWEQFDEICGICAGLWNFNLSP